MNAWMNEWMNEWMHEWMNEWMHEWMHEPKVIRAPRFFYERLFKPEFTHSRPVALATTRWFGMMMWLASWWHYDDVVDIWNRALATVLCTFCRPHLPKVLQTRKFFNMFKWKSISRYSLLRLFPTSSPKNAPNPTVIAFSSSGNWALDTVSWHVVHRPKVLQARQWRFRARECFQDFSSLNSRIPDLSRFPTITYMMMWLPWWLRWWCGCHHGEKASHDNCS